MFKIIFLLILLATGILLFTSSQVIAGNTGDIKIVITGCASDRGLVKIGLSDTKENYDKRGGVFMKAAAEIKQGKAEHVFTDLPYGEYAVRTYHDENGNNRFDRFLGLPRESYGFSNDAKGRVMPPDYEQAKFPLDSGSVTVEIELR